MERAEHTLVVTGSKDAIGAIRGFVDEQPGSQSQASERLNLDGDTATWIVIASLAGQALPHVLNFLRDYLIMNRVRRIKVGNIEIENPSPEDMDRIRVRLDPRPIPDKPT